MPSLFETACVCWGYALVTGMSAPVVRAAGAFTLYLIARYLFRRVRVLNILAALGFVYLILDPDALFDASFQLSFLSAAALAAFALPLMERWTEPLRVASRTIDRTAVHPNQNARIATVRVEMRLFAETLAVWLKCPLPVATVAVSLMGKCLSYVVETILVSACVQLGLALPMIAYFHRLSITGLSANVVIIPLLSLVVPLGFGAIATHSGLLAGITAACLHWAQVVAAWHRMLEPSWRIATVPFEVAILFAASLALFAWSLRRQRHRILSGAMCLVVFGVICFQPWKPKLRAGWLEVSAIDVSQGDSLFVAFPDGRTMLVDAGGFPGIGNMQRTPNLDMGEDVVSPYLWSRQIQRLDYVVLTHGHSDHMQGLCAVLTNYHPRELWTGPEPESAQWREARKCATASGTAIKQLSSDAPIREFGKARVRVLSPAPQYAAGEAAGNNDSLVLMIEMGKRSALLTGDAERAAEDAILENCHLPGVTLLKVGHHGSKTSSSDEFLDALKPQFAFISAGYLNQFHHPHRDVLQRLEDRHAMVLRTDRNGLSMFLTDGDRVEVSSYWP
jgi:competence protein ComEC